MVATDVAARGLHIRNLPYVVNYDFPSRLETYIHRVGRTGRLSASGHAFSFLTRNLAPLAGPLVTFLQVSFASLTCLSATPTRRLSRVSSGQSLGSVAFQRPVTGGTCGAGLPQSSLTRRDPARSLWFPRGGRRARGARCEAWYSSWYACPAASHQPGPGVGETSRMLSCLGASYHRVAVPANP